MLTYGLLIAALLLAVLQLAKDWPAHQTTWRRVGVLVLIVLFGVGSGINSYYSNKRAAAQYVSDQAEIKSLKTEISSLRAAVVGVQTELQKPPKPPAPGPKAELSFTFAPFPNSPPGQPIVLVTDKRLPLSADGSAHVDF